MKNIQANMMACRLNSDGEDLACRPVLEDLSPHEQALIIDAGTTAVDAMPHIAGNSALAALACLLAYNNLVAKTVRHGIESAAPSVEVASFVATCVASIRECTAALLRSLDRQGYRLVLNESGIPVDMVKGSATAGDETDGDERDLLAERIGPAKAAVGMELAVQYAKDLAVALDCETSAFAVLAAGESSVYTAAKRLPAADRAGFLAAVDSSIRANREVTELMLADEYPAAAAE